MTDQTTSEQNDTSKPPQKSKKPPISKKTAAHSEPPPADPLITPPPVEPAPPAPQRETQLQATRPLNRTATLAPEDPAAELRSRQLEALLQVDSYDDAEAVLSQDPDLVETARQVFGAIVPTSQQNELIDLAIRATADDDSMTLKSALRLKREGAVNLNQSEVTQLLEFANEQLSQSPGLALNTALLVTDDLTELEEARLWQKQKTILTRLERELDLDVVALWEQVSVEPEPEPEPVAVEPQPEPEPDPEPVLAELEPEPEPEPTPVKKKKRKRVPPPPPPVAPPKKKRRGPARWLLATGFMFMMSLSSCAACAMVGIF